MSTLFLVPTALERDGLRVNPRFRSLTENSHVELCGWGPVNAAAATSRWISVCQPERVILLGIAGTLSTDWPVGTACRFTGVGLDGIGAGRGDTFKSARILAWNRNARAFDSPAIDELILFSFAHDLPIEQRILLTVCAASANEADARFRRERHPRPIAEDMEGYGVAAACELADVPLEIVRGMSNLAGNRNMAQWQIAESLDAVVEVLEPMV